MNYNDSKYIEICKKQLEETFSFGNGQGYTQKDLELLALHIEEKTGVSISLSTLKRLWKNNFKQGPQLATLNALVMTLGYSNWQNFKLENKIDPTSEEKSIISYNSSTKDKTTSYKKATLLILLLLSIGAVLFYSTKEKEDIVIPGETLFKANKTLTKGVPNTVIFNYDVSKIEADSFFIQQSWNKWRREKIDPNKTVFSSIYYESGFHRAKLIANNQVISQQPIHILSDGWESHLYYKESDERFIDFKGFSFIKDRKLHLSENILKEKNINLLNRFSTRVSNSKVFNVSSDNFNFITKTKLDSNQFNTNCPWLTILLVTEKHIFSVGLKKKGCEVFAHYKLGEIYKNGKNTDLRFLGLDLYDWHDIGFNVKNKKATILIDGKPAYTEIFKEDFGDIVGLTFIYEGTGSIDYVKLTDENEKVAFEDNFER